MTAESEIALICDDSWPARCQHPVCLPFSLSNISLPDLSENLLIARSSPLFILFDSLREDGRPRVGVNAFSVRRDVAAVVSVCMDAAVFSIWCGAAPVSDSYPACRFISATSDAELRCGVGTDLCLMCERGPITQQP